MKTFKIILLKLILFCRPHFLVGLADRTESPLKALDSLLHDDRPVGSFENDGYFIGESGTLLLTRYCW